MRCLSGMDTKQALRQRLLGARKDMSAEQLIHAADRIAEQLAELVNGRRRIAAYRPFGTEPGGPDMPRLLRDLVAEVLFPVLLPDNDLDWELDDRAQGVAAIATAEMIVVPALAVDHDGYRLGRGGGSYDRALARVKGTAMIVALLHEGELVPAVPHEAHDQRVNVALTPSRLVRLDSALGLTPWRVRGVGGPPAEALGE